MTMITHELVCSPPDHVSWCDAAPDEEGGQIQGILQPGVAATERLCAASTICSSSFIGQHREQVCRNAHAHFIDWSKHRHY